jgi:hypothetical protein
MPISPKQMTRNELVELLADPVKIAVWHRTNLHQPGQVVDLIVPVALFRAFSPLFASQSALGNSSSFTVTGGTRAGCEKVLQWMVSSCFKKTVIPTVDAASAKLDWIRIHQAAELMGVKLFEKNAIVQLETCFFVLPDAPLNKAELTYILENHHIDSRLPIRSASLTERLLCSRLRE